ncbi:MAG: DUF4416 family protein [Candidatus Glassbacteria bacterium]|nr:DUF4416 family protein [Candidatus Glassbacteria bacterium]
MKTNPPAKHLVEPVKLFMAVLYSDKAQLDKARQRLREIHGEEDFVSQSVPFDHTDFYRDEMGGPLERIFISYRELVEPGRLVDVKLAADRIERELAGADGGRTVNIDPGLLDYQKVVLASFKFGGQKIYLDQGVWADLTLYYRKGGWSVFEWTFPDFKAGLYDSLLLEIRTLYKRQRKEAGG